MTRISPRDSEVETVIDLMESGDYETPEALAKAIVVAVAGELAQRTTLGIAAGFPGEAPSMAVGPFYHAEDVKKWREEAQEAGLETRVRRLSSPGALLPAEALETVSCECGHQKEQHVIRVKNNKPGPPRECGVLPDGRTKCPCGSFTRKAS